MNNKQKFAVFGNPVGHSLSPLMHNAAFKKMNFDAVYTAILAEDAASIPKEIIGSNIKGASITIPHKTSIMKYLDRVSESSLKIGAVNTVTNLNGELKGDNTDWTGFVLALKEFSQIRKKTFAVIGAGGVARSAVFGIIEEGGIPVILNRTKEKGEKLAEEFGCEFRPLAEIGNMEAHCLVNATKVGMFPNVDESPVSRHALRNFGCVMDIIYNPLKTKLLKDAEAEGCLTATGVSMFVHQGAEQIRIWTGLNPPTDFMKKIVLEKLENETD
jgi:shikimate dehydrogenase